MQGGADVWRRNPPISRGKLEGRRPPALSRFGKPGVPQLTEMLQDPDLAVSVEAALALQSNREDPLIAIPRLTKALSRADLARSAANALSAYGVEARQAIPAIIKAHPLAQGQSPFLDAAEEALQHIGPPRDADIPRLCEYLTRDEETRIVVAKSLGLLGLNGKSAANALEAAAENSIKEYVRLVRKPTAPWVQARPDPMVSHQDAGAADAATLGKWHAITEILLKAGAKYDIRSACYLNDVERVRALLKDKKQARDTEAMRLAAMYGRVKIVKLLLAGGADPEGDYSGLTASYFAIEHPKALPGGFQEIRQSPEGLRSLD